MLECNMTCHVILWAVFQDSNTKCLSSGASDELMKRNFLGEYFWWQFWRTWFINTLIWSELMTRHFFVFGLSLSCLYSVNWESFFKCALSRHVWYTGTSLGKKIVVTESSCGISISKRRKEESQKILGNPRSFLQMYSRQISETYKSETWGAKICVGEDLAPRWGMFIWTKAVYSPYMWKRETEDAHSEMPFNCGMCIQERCNLFCYNINRWNSSGKCMYHLINTKIAFRI
jgi:hypothetical protein